MVFESAEFKSEVHSSRDLISYSQANSNRAAKETDRNAYDFLENIEVGVFTCEKFESGIQSPDNWLVTSPSTQIDLENKHYWRIGMRQLPRSNDVVPYTFRGVGAVILIVPAIYLYVY